MSKLSVLLKNEFYNITGINKLAKGPDRAKTVLISAAVVFAFVSLLGSITAYYYMIADGLEKVGALNLLPIFAIIFCSAMVLITTIYSAQGMLFSFKDFDLLMSMPIKNRTILSAKILLFVLMNVAVSLFTVLPAALIFYVRTMPSPIYLLYMLIVILLIPLLPIIISSMLALAISYVSSKSRHKNLIITVISFLLFFAVMIGSFMSSSVASKLSADARGIGESIASFYPVGRFFCDALTKTDIASLMLGLLSSVVPFALFVLFFSKAYKKINLKLSETYRKGNFTLRELKSSKPWKALFIKEIKYYFSTPIYILNTAVGPILMIVLAFGVIFGGSGKILSILKLPEVAGQLPQMLIVIFSAMVVLSCTSCTSISLEGNSFWIIKSMPVATDAVFAAKALLNIIINVPFVIISAMILQFALGLTVLQTAYLILIPTLYSILSAQGGLLVNLYVPKMSWASPTVVIKQSMSVMLAMVVNAITVAIPVILYIAIKPSNPSAFLSIASLLLIIANVAAMFLLKTVGAKLYRKIAA